LRESLTVLAALLILCLSVALVGPYFVDWNSQRDLIARQLSEALGEKVSIGGAVDLKLLPTPYLHLEDIAIKDPEGPSFTAHDLFLELAIPPLLSGKMDFIQAHIKQPVIKFKLGTDGTLEGPQPQGFSGQARFERIVFEDGRIEIDDEAQGRPIVLDKLGLDAQAEALTGPFKGDGRASIAGEMTAFHLSTGPLDNGAMRLKFILDKSTTHPRGEIDGALAVTKKPSKRFALSFNGTGTLIGFWPAEAKADQTIFPWRLNGPLKVSERKAAMETFDLRLGEESASAALTGEAALDFTGNPKADLSLRATRLDLDRLLAGGTGPGPIVAALVDIPQKAALPLNLSLSASTVIFKGEALTDLSAALAANPGQPLYLRYESGLPWRSRLLLDGHLASPPAYGFDGKLSGNTEDLSRLTSWLGDFLPAPVLAAMKDQPFRDIDAIGEISVSPAQWSAHDAFLRLDQTTVSGDFAFTPASGKAPPKLALALTTTTLDFDKLPDLKNLGGLSNGLDLSLRFDAAAAKFARPQKGVTETGAIHLDLSREGQQAELKALTLKTPDGATLTAKANWNGESGQFETKIDALKLDDLFKLAQRLPVDLPLDQLEPKALTPLKLDLHADLTSAGQKDTWPGLANLTLKANAAATQISAAIAKTPQGTQAALTIDAPESASLFRQLGWDAVTLGPLGAAHIEAKMPWPLGPAPTIALKAALAKTAFTFDGRVTPGILSDLASSNADGRLTLASKDLSPLLQISGLGTDDLTRRIPAELSANLGWADKRLSLGDLKGTLAAAPFSGRLALATGNGPAKLTGAIDLDQSSAAELASLALGPPQLAKPGTLWSSLAFAPASFSLPQASITVRAKNFELWPGLSATNTALQLETGAGVFTLRDITMQLGNGTASGTLTLRRDGALAALSGHLAVANYALALPSLSAQASLDLDLAGSGQNALSLVSSLSGTGHANFANLSVPQADPSGLERVLADVEHDKISVDEASINRALAAEFDKGALQAGGLPLDIGIAAGVMRFAPVTAQPLEAQALSDFSLALDARSAAIDERLALRPVSLPRRWQGPVPSLSLSYKGKLLNPQRMIESSSFVNTMAARSIAREQARIQAYEFDLRERLFFNQRLQSERKREVERLAALEEAKRAAEAARKADEAAKEAARLEKIRKAEEAKKEEARKRAEETVPPEQHQQPASAKPNALQPQRQDVPADPSTAGRY